MKRREELKKLVDDILSEPFDVEAERKAPGGRQRITLRAAVVEVRLALKEPAEPQETKR